MYQLTKPNNDTETFATLAELKDYLRQHGYSGYSSLTSKAIKSNPIVVSHYIVFETVTTYDEKRNASSTRMVKVRKEHIVSWVDESETDEDENLNEIAAAFDTYESSENAGFTSMTRAATIAAIGYLLSEYAELCRYYITRDNSYTKQCMLVNSLLGSANFSSFYEHAVTRYVVHIIQDYVSGIRRA